MSDYTIQALTEVPDIFAGQYLGAMRFLTDHAHGVQCNSPTAIELAPPTAT